MLTSSNQNQSCIIFDEFKQIFLHKISHSVSLNVIIFLLCCFFANFQISWLEMNLKLTFGIPNNVFVINFYNA